MSTPLTKEPSESSFFEEHFILNLKNSWKRSDCSLKMHLVKLYTRNHFFSWNSPIFSIHALIVDKTLLPMIVYFAIAMLPFLYYCIIVSNKYIMSKKPIFKSQTNCYVLDSIMNSVGCRDCKCGSNRTHGCIADCSALVFDSVSTADMVAGVRQAGNASIEVQPVFWFHVCSTQRMKQTHSISSFRRFKGL